MAAVILLRPETPENIGFIARAMKNFDMAELVIIGALCDPKDDAAIKIAMHAKEVLSNAIVLPYQDFSSAMKKYDMVVGTTSALGTDYNIPRTPLEPRELAKKISDSAKAAIVFGNEGSGMNNDELRVCTHVVSIPTSRRYPAMNISHAAAILFYEIYMEYGKNKINSHISKASRKEKEIMLEIMYGIIDYTAFSTKEKRETQKEVWKKLFEQSGMSKREAFAVIGLLRKLKP